jgi:hypothetical protein
MEKKTKEKATLWSALSAFQAECPAINKGKKGYNYKYADLPAIMEVINPILKKNGLVIAQPLEGRSVVTKLIYIPTGEVQESRIDIPEGVVLQGMNQFQSDGSAITYYRRYCLSSLLSIVVEEDTDAAGKQEKASKSQPIVNTGTKMFEHCVARYADGMSRMDMSEHVTISDATWKEIVKASNSQQL